MALPAITPSGVSTAFVYPRDTAGGTGLEAFIDADPGSINPPIIFEPDCELTGDEPQVWIVASGALPSSGGCDVWISSEAAGSYGLIGRIGTRGTQGALIATFASGSDPDTANTLSVSLLQSQTSLIAGTAADADDSLTLSYVGGELVAYSAATLTAPYQYDLDTYIRRGLYGTTIASHAAGAQFARLTPAVFRQTYPRNLIGKTLYFKFTSFNGLGLREEDLADVPYYSHLLTGNGVSGLIVTTVTQGSTATLAASAACSLDNLVEVIAGSLAGTTINGPTRGVVKGLRYIIKDANNNAGTYPIAFVPHSPETVDGASSYNHTFSNGSVEMIWDGAAWVVTG